MGSPSGDADAPNRDRRNRAFHHTIEGACACSNTCARLYLNQALACTKLGMPELIR
jgi:hypothetical protein